jgi:glutamate dehydrogenase
LKSTQKFALIFFPFPFPFPSLALTQQKKNKDIPEGGSKGVILPTAKHVDHASTFKRYIDGILDMLIPDTVLEPERKQGDDMIFIGPDENTAGWSSIDCIVLSD